MRANATTPSLTHSRGIALIAGLLLLASMVILALAVATGMLLERRMTGNFADGQLALQRAQIAGRWAEYWLDSRTGNPLDPNCTENCGPTPPVFENGQLPERPEFENGAWWQLNAAVAGTEPGTGSVRLDYTLAGTSEPLWMIEELHMEPIEGLASEPEAPEPELGYYRVLARGSGRLPGSVAVIESIIARPWVSEYVPTPYPPAVDGPWFCDQVSEDIPCGRTAWRRRR